MGGKPAEYELFIRNDRKERDRIPSAFEYAGTADHRVWACTCSIVGSEIMDGIYAAHGLDHSSPDGLDAPSRKVTARLGGSTPRGTHP